MFEKGVLDDGFHLSHVVFEVLVRVPGGNGQEAVGNRTQESSLGVWGPQLVASRRGAVWMRSHQGENRRDGMNPGSGGLRV